MPDFQSVLTAYGFVVDRVIPDGRWHRVKTTDKMKHRNGAYLLRPDGMAGWFKNWATDQGFNTWNADGEQTPAQKRQIEADAQAARKRETAYRDRAIKTMRDYWQSLPLLRGGHPYLDGKGLDMRGCVGLRHDGEFMVVPVNRDGQVMSLQTIAPDGRKRFRMGCPVKGGVYLLDRPKAVLTCFVEGLATGLAVYQSLPQCRVIVCFDSGNLVEVSSRFIGCGLGVVCADNDTQTEQKIGTNPGLVAGQKAAEAMGCGLAYPQGIEGSDWADAIKEMEPDARRWINRNILMKAKPFKRVGVVP